MTTRSNARGRRLHAGRAAVGLALTVSAAVSASPAVEKAKPETTTAAASTPQVVSTERTVPPRRKVVRRRFRPWARPSARRVRQIIRAEGRRWHISPSRLARRVACESRFRWWAGNGVHQGLLQFSPSTFRRGLRSMRTRRVKLVRSRWRRVYEMLIVRYSDGRVEHRRGRRRRQRLVLVYVGSLPRRPSIVHAWAQLRIGAQAMRGISVVRSSEWSCPA